MQHRHLNHERFTLAAIDDAIARGRWQDWIDLRAAAVADPGVLAKVQRICEKYLADPSAQRQHFWNRYVHARQASQAA